MSTTHSTTVAVPDDGTSPVGTDEWNAAHVSESAFEFVIGDGVNVIGTGVKFDFEVPFGCTIASWTLLADVSGSIVIDLWRDSYANFPPTVADTITASAKPTITAATKATSSTLTGWSTALTKGQVLRVNVDSAATVKRVTLSLGVTEP